MMVKSSYSRILVLLFILFPAIQSLSQDKIPSVLQNIGFDKTRGYYLVAADQQKIYQIESGNRYSFSNLTGNPAGNRFGIILDFNDPELNGRIYYGLIHYSDSKYPHPVYRSTPAPILGGKAFLNLNQVRGKYDMTGWEDSGSGTIGYRVITNSGFILYDGKVSFSGTGPFEVVNTLISGPFVNLLSHEGATISFETSEESVCKIVVGGKTFSDKRSTKKHEIKVKGLEPDKEYTYGVIYGNLEQHYSFKTAPLPGARGKFVFAYSSDSRGGSGWGERNIYGANTYIIKKIMAVSAYYNVAFSQFTGDMISGYKTSKEAMLLEYHNWMNAIEPFAHHFPVILAIGNHEALTHTFHDSLVGMDIDIDKFPYDSESSEALFSEIVVNPRNGPASEDGSIYDPVSGQSDFPSYEENVFYYTYDNVAIISLNSDYWYTPTLAAIPFVGGNNHGYIMDNQLSWLKKTVKKMEKEETVDHIFITIHTPFFPNGGHVHDDMWYHGDNRPRPWINGIPVEKGILERRDQLLDILINNSKKVVALLTGDEHNYCKTVVGPETEIYPENYEGEKLSLQRTVYQINNGAAGAPYYAQETTPWTPFTSGFTTQNAVCLFTVEGEKIDMVVINPDTLEEIDRLRLR